MHSKFDKFAYETRDRISWTQRRVSRIEGDGFNIRAYTTIAHVPSTLGSSSRD